MGSEQTVRAAGGIVVRNGVGEPAVVVIHRPEYDDWTLPKGKCEPGESWEDCALREVEEETGLRCRFLAPVGATRYVDRNGRPKEVRWWLMRPEAGELRGQSEVDVARWLAPAEAAKILTYGHDRDLLRKVLKESRVWLVRHADAGDRSAWTQPDELRPLDRRGREQARRLGAWLRAERIDRLVSSPYVRCVQTLEPLGRELGKSVEALPELGEGRGLAGIGPLLSAGQAVVACTHGDVLDELLGELRRDSLVPAGARAQKASTWVLRSRAGLVQSAEYVPPPS